MSDIIARILDNPATAYILSFGTLGALLNIALNNAHKYVKLDDRKWGLVTLGTGALGGVLLQAAGLVQIPTSNVVAHLLAAFIGAACASAAAGFSAIDLRNTVTKPKE